MRTTTKLVLRAAAVVAFAAALSPQALGQGNDVERAKRAEQERRAGEDARRMAAWELRLLEQRKTQERRRDPDLAWAQIREDYKQIQIVNNDLARAVEGPGALDFKYVVKSVSEIRKRAARLKENMVLPEAGKSAERPRPAAGAEGEQLKSSLSALDRLVIEFVNNPIFERAKTVDVQMSVKARRDLEEIIEVSDRIKRSSEKLKEVARPTP